MNKEVDNSLWRAIGASVIGKSHLIKGLSNQDAICCNPPLDGTGPYVVAVADGHGQAKSVRSSDGSKLAVDIARNSLCAFSKYIENNHQNSPNLWKNLAEENLCSEIVETWREKVEQDFIQRPFSEEELRKISSQSSDLDKSSQLKAYGTTLLAALVAKDFILVLQVGDGGIAAINERGEFSRPLPDDPLNIGNQTTSLSDTDAKSRMRIRLMHIEGSIPVMLLLCTDGYENAFPSQVFQQVCYDFVQELREPLGWARVYGYLEECLEEASNQATGDDATMGILFRENADYSQWIEKSEAYRQENFDAEEDTSEALSEKVASDNLDDPASSVATDKEDCENQEEVTNTSLSTSKTEVEMTNKYLTKEDSATKKSNGYNP